MLCCSTDDRMKAFWSFTERLRVTEGMLASPALMCSNMGVALTQLAKLLPFSSSNPHPIVQLPGLGRSCRWAARKERSLLLWVSECALRDLWASDEKAWTLDPHCRVGNVKDGILRWEDVLREMWNQLSSSMETELLKAAWIYTFMMCWEKAETSDEPDHLLQPQTWRALT